MGIWATLKTIRTSPEEQRRKAPARGGAVPNALSVKFVRGSRDGETLRLKGTKWTIGTHPGAEIRFDVDEDDAVDSRHGVIHYANNLFAYQPVEGSFSFLNGKPVVRQTRVNDGDEITLGVQEGPALRVVLEVVDPRELVIPTVTVKIERGFAELGPREFTKGFTIGRSRENDVQFNTPQVSSRHAEIKWDGSRWLVEDLQSTNGTFIDGRRIERVAVENGVTLELSRGGPMIVLEVEQKQEAKEEPAAHHGSVTQLVQHYLGPASGDMGRRTMIIRQAFQDVKKKQAKRYKSLLAIAGVIVVVIAAALIYQSYRVQRLEELHGLAEDMFYAMKGLELQIAELETAVEKYGDETLRRQVAERRAQQRQMQNNYGRFAQEVGISPDKLSEKDWLVYKVARLFGECDVNMPPGFLQKVNQYIGYWQKTPRLRQAMERAQRNRYAPTIAREMLENNLPPQFFYLALQESDMDINRCGPATRYGFAKGMWQFIPKTAVKYGLRTGPLVELRRVDPRDDRHDFEKSTHAAAKYIRFLYETEAQASGLLVMACYNWGEDKVEPLVKSMPENPHDRNFWKLLADKKIPDQTYDYVFYIVSAAVIGENPKLFGFDFENPLKGLE